MNPENDCSHFKSLETGFIISSFKSGVCCLRGFTFTALDKLFSMKPFYVARITIMLIADVTKVKSCLLFPFSTSQGHNSNSTHASDVIVIAGMRDTCNNNKLIKPYYGVDQLKSCYNH